MAYSHMMSIIKNRPLDINIETINQCPLKCVFCCNRKYQRGAVVMDRTLFQDIVKQYYDLGGGALGLSSMQSDFFSDPDLIERMKIIKKYKKRLWVYSTTPLISCKKYNDRELAFILGLFDYLQISVEGHDRETYSRMAGVDGFNTLQEQLERIQRIIRDNSLKIRVDLHFRTYQREKLLRSKFYSQWSCVFNAYEIKDRFFSWFGTIMQEEIPRGARIIYVKNNAKRENCVVPSASLAVMADGKVLGCGCIDWLEKYVIGNCRTNTLLEVWRSPKAVKFRNAFASGKIPSICKECGLYTSVNCMRDKKYLNYKPEDGLYYLKT